MTAMPPPISLSDRLVLLCSRTEMDDQRRDKISAILKKDVDWQRVFLQARETEMLPLLNLHLTRLGSDLIPAKILMDLQQENYQNLAHNMLLESHLLDLVRLFKNHHFPVVPVKGILLAETVYGDIGLRRMLDLDVLVRREHVEDSVKFLIQDGYQLVSPLPVQHSDYDRSQRDVTLTKTVGKRCLQVELHWKFKDAFFRLPEDLLWKNLTLFSWKGESVSILNREMTLLHLIHHLNYHGYPLKILVDVAETIRAYKHEMDWNRLSDLVQASRMRRNFHAAAESIRKVLEEPLPQEIAAITGGCFSRNRVVSLVADPRWYFEDRGKSVRGDEYLCALFSALFLDGTYLDLLKVLLRRFHFGSVGWKKIGRSFHLASRLFRMHQSSVLAGNKN